MRSGWGSSTSALNLCPFDNNSIIMYTYFPCYLNIHWTKFDFGNDQSNSDANPYVVWTNIMFRQQSDEGRHGPEPDIIIH